MILERHYVHPKCSPSRASLLTGRYAWTMGRRAPFFSCITARGHFMISTSTTTDPLLKAIITNLKSLRQRGAIERFQPTGLSTKFPLLPEILKVQQIPPSCTQVLMGRFALLIPNLEHYRLTWCLISSWNNLTWSNWKIPSLGATQLTWWENGTWASATRSSSLPGAFYKER